MKTISLINGHYYKMIWIQYLQIWELVVYNFLSYFA